MDAIEKAYTQHAQDVYRYLLSLSHDEDLAEELTQETFFRAMKTIKNYDGSCKLSVWLCQIGKHLWYQWLDKHSKHNTVELTNEISDNASPEKQAMLSKNKPRTFFRFLAYNSVYTVLSAFNFFTSSRESPEIFAISSKAYFPAIFFPI